MCSKLSTELTFENVYLSHYLKKSQKVSVFSHSVQQIEYDLNFQNAYLPHDQNEFSKRPDFQSFCVVNWVLVDFGKGLPAALSNQLAAGTCVLMEGENKTNKNKVAYTTVRVCIIYMCVHVCV